MFSLAETDLVIVVNGWLEKVGADTTLLPSGTITIGELATDGSTVVDSPSADRVTVGSIVATADER